MCNGSEVASCDDPSWFGVEASVEPLCCWDNTIGVDAAVALMDVVGVGIDVKGTIDQSYLDKVLRGCVKAWPAADRCDGGRWAIDDPHASFGRRVEAMNPGANRAAAGFGLGRPRLWRKQANDHRASAGRRDRGPLAIAGH